MSERARQLIPASPGSQLVSAYFKYGAKAPDVERLPVIAWYVSGGQIETAVTPIGPYPVKAEREDTLVYAARAIQIGEGYFDSWGAYEDEKAWLQAAGERWEAMLAALASELRGKIRDRSA